MKRNNFFKAVGLWFKRVLVSIGLWFKHIFIKDEENERSLGKMFRTEGGKSFLSSLVCILIGIVFGCIVIVLINPGNAGRAITNVLLGGFNAPNVARGLGRLFTDFPPLLLCGLSILFAYKCGLFNIGAAGQYVMGILFLYIGALGLNAPWYICIIMAIIGGMLWGAIPGFLKAFCGVNEVIACIMTNWIGLLLCNGVLSSGVYYNVLQAKCFSIQAASPNSLLPTLGLDKLFGGYKYIGIALFIGIIVAILVSVVLNKTKFGYEIKATGSNKHAARYAGMNEKRNVIFTMAIAGGIAGLAAGCYYLTGIMQYNPNVASALPVMGFNGIAVAFLGALSPIGTIFSTLFITHISIGGAYLDSTYYSKEVSDLISSVIIYACAFSLFFKMIIEKVLKSKKEKLNGDILSKDRNSVNSSKGGQSL